MSEMHIEATGRGSCAAIQEDDASALSMRFLGIGGSSAQGSPSAVLESGQDPVLMIDCGPDAVERFSNQYGRLPKAIYLTHTHGDHVGGLETLFHALMPTAAGDPNARVSLYVPAPIIPSLQDKIGAGRFARAEGEINFWDGFHLIPVSSGFWLSSLWFRSFESRHMRPQFCYGVSLRGAFVFTGDTRPIPEVLREYAGEDEVVFHDCSVRANPAHSGFVDLLNEYPGRLLDRIVAYHYGTVDNGRRLEQHGFRIAKLGRCYPLPSPVDLRGAGRRLAS